MDWLSLFLKKIVSEAFLTSFNFWLGSCYQLIKAYCVNVVVDIKPIYLNKHYLFQNKIYYLDKIYFGLAKIRKAFQTYSVKTKLVIRLVKKK